MTKLFGDTILQPLLLERVQSKLQAAHEANTTLATELQDEESLRTLSECESQMSHLFSSETNRHQPLVLIIEDAYQVLAQIAHSHEMLSKKVKKNTAHHTQEIRDQAKQSVEEAKDLIHYCQQHQETICDSDEQEDEALGHRLKQEIKALINAPCQSYSDEDILRHLHHWTCKLNLLSPKLKFVPPELAEKFLEKVNMDIRKMSVTPHNHDDQREAMANLLKIREGLSSLQTGLLNRVTVNRPLAARK